MTYTFTIDDVQRWADTADQKYGIVVEEINCCHSMRRYILKLVEPEQRTVNEQGEIFIGDMVKLEAVLGYAPEWICLRGKNGDLNVNVNIGEQVVVRPRGYNGQVNTRSL